MCIVSALAVRAIMIVTLAKTFCTIIGIYIEHHLSLPARMRFGRKMHPKDIPGIMQLARMMAAERLPHGAFDQDAVRLR